MNKTNIIRGAICAENTEDSIGQNAVMLISEIMRKNGLEAERVSAVFFSATADLNACYPAAEVRKKLLPNAAFMCFAEMPVVGSLDHCIRAAVFAETDGEARHCYLGRAAALRPDLC